MTQEITTVTPFGSHPYLTIDEYKQAPTGIDWDDLVGGGSQAVNDVELFNVISRASSWADGLVGQVLAATLDTETLRGRVSRDGMLRVHPRFWPIVSVVSAAYGFNPMALTNLDPSTAWLEEMSVVFPLVSANAAFLGQLQFAGNYAPNAQQFVTITYVNGYANALLSTTASLGTTQLAVTELAGFVPGMKFTVFDGANTEILQVASNHVPATGTGNVLLAAATTASHGSGVSVSALPAAVKQAVIYLTNVILKSRGNSALVMQSINTSQVNFPNDGIAGDYDAAKTLLKPYRRIR